MHINSYEPFNNQYIVMLTDFCTSDLSSTVHWVQGIVHSSLADNETVEMFTPLLLLQYFY